jgi:hypothetical protein
MARLMHQVAPLSESRGCIGATAKRVFEKIYFAGDASLDLRATSPSLLPPHRLHLSYQCAMLVEDGGRQACAQATEQLRRLA